MMIKIYFMRILLTYFRNSLSSERALRRTHIRQRYVGAASISHLSFPKPNHTKILSSSYASFGLDATESYFSVWSPFRHNI
jgi:hypothetical protein